MKVVAISDTHNRTVDVPDGDVLIHIGDGTSMGTVDEIMNLSTWLNDLPHKRKIFIPGNHDFLFERRENLARDLMGDVAVLIDEELMIDGRKFYGSPWSGVFGHWAFMATEMKLQRMFAPIPEDLDVLAVHGPMKGMLDQVAREPKPHVGSVALLEAVKRTNPRYFLCGHIHEAYGRGRVGDTRCFNVSICNLAYNAVNAPVTFEV